MIFRDSEPSADNSEESTTSEMLNFYKTSSEPFLTCLIQEDPYRLGLSSLLRVLIECGDCNVRHLLLPVSGGKITRRSLTFSTGR